MQLISKIKASDLDASRLRGNDDKPSMYGGLNFMSNYKVCNRCKISKSLEDFSICKKHSDGRQYTCIVCSRFYCKTKVLPKNTKIEGEIWDIVVGYELEYSASKLGRIKSLERILFKKNGIQYTAQERILDQYKDPKGYLRVCLHRDGKGRCVPVHRLIAKSFIPNPHNLPQVNHINCDKTDNRVENLEWCTNEANIEHAVKNGLFKPRRGITHGMSKRVKNLVTGHIFSCIREAAESIQMQPPTLEAKLNGRIKNNTDLIKID